MVIHCSALSEKNLNKKFKHPKIPDEYATVHKISDLINEESFKDAKQIFYGYGDNETLQKVIQTTSNFQKTLKFVTKYLKFEDVCHGLDLLSKELYGDAWYSILLASEVYQSQCHDLWYLTIKFKMNPVTKWVSDEVCLENMFYEGEYLYPTNDNSKSNSGKVLVSKAGKHSENRKHWIFIPNLERDFTYKIYNRASKQYLNFDLARKRNGRSTLVISDYAQLWKLEYLTENELEIKSVDFKETLYAYRGNSSTTDLDFAKTYTRKDILSLWENTIWRVSFWCNE
jgi:hypothetical protein